MSAPINEFIKKYAQSGTVRFHMPGHKGVKFHGMEDMDITEIRGADYLFEPDGIIAQSEAQTAAAFHTARTLYSTEGSSLCIKTMLAVIELKRKSKGERMLCIAPRNVHKAFINACILLDAEVFWVYPKKPSSSICCGEITAEDIEKAIADCENSEFGRKPDCVYVTSPDYLGNICDIRGMAEVCHINSIPLICDNAHGAYLKFLEEDIHPITLGADMCCDSAHKTLPCYTGGAYLHISKNAPKGFSECVKNAMSLFASTSPSYLIMQSLDLCSEYINGDYRKELAETVKRTALCKERIASYGWVLCGDEKCKITINANRSGLEGTELGDMLRENGIEPEYTDFTYVVLMITPFNKERDLEVLEKAMEKIVQPKIRVRPQSDDIFIPRAKPKMNIRRAAFSDCTSVKVDDAEGRICAMTVTCCQPSVPIVISGEEITADIIKILKRYSIYEINVI